MAYQFHRSLAGKLIDLCAQKSSAWEVLNACMCARKRPCVSLKGLLCCEWFLSLITLLAWPLHSTLCFISGSNSLTTALEKPVPHYVKREVLWSKVLKIAHSDKTNTAVTLVGGVGIGKTELMKDICLDLQEKYVIIQVLEASKCSDIPQSICQILKQISFDVQPNQGSIISCLKKLETALVFSLDVSRLPHTHDNCNSMWGLISQIQSLPYCKLLLISIRFTSCMICNQERENTTTMIVNPLDYHESIAAVRNLNVTIDPKYYKDIANHCQGFPIHLNEVEGHDVPGFLDKPIYFASTQHIYADKSFKMYVKRCGSEVKKALACLCLIKDEFPLELAVQMLEVEKKTVSKICNHLIKEQLLLERSGNYQMPWIMQHYMTHMINADETLKAMTKKGKKSLIQLLLKFLYKSNELFMHYQNTPECRLYDELLNRVVPVPLRRGPAVKALGFYKKYKRSFEWILKEGISDKSLGLAELVADCMNECVSFLAKAMERSTVINLYQKLKSCKRIKRNEIRNACTDISIGFLKMYHNSCHFESESISKMLRAALKSLRNFESRHSVLEQLTEHFHLEEVEAHCLSKLGHIIAANFPDSFSEGESMIRDALKIRQQECLNGSGSRLLVASVYYDIASKFVLLVETSYRDGTRNFPKLFQTVSKLRHRASPMLNLPSYKLSTELYFNIVTKTQTSLHKG